MAATSSSPPPVGSKKPCSGSAVSGARNASSGKSRAWSPPRWVMPAAIRPNATYEEVCSGRTGHTEVVRVVYDPNKVSYDTLLKAFWESHDPTQGMRQGGDVGTQYRSAIYTTTDAQHKAAEASKRSYQEALTKAHRATITTEIKDAPEF